MKRISILAACMLLALAVFAQTAREEIKADIYKSASNHMAYPGPQKVLTACPEGKKPFYISHYGRHGSRYLCGEMEYGFPLGVLKRAEKSGKLTELGKDVLRRVELISNEAYKRVGELTPLGAEQHRNIAKRMFERFPEIFADSANVDAKSTVVIRCILSMENALQQLKGMNPKLKIRHDASNHDMYYMNFGKDWIENRRIAKETKVKFNEWKQKHCVPDRLMSVLFNDASYAKDSIPASPFFSALFKVASIIQNQEARHKVTLYDIFTEEEIYNLWEHDNISWYLGYGGNPQNNGLPPYIQRNLLRKIIEEADSCMLLEKPGATLRYGHETMVLPLSFLMELNNNAVQVIDLEQITANWQNYKCFPMAANIQLVFYRADVNDKDILVKVLFNEDEATLPVKTDCAPYYHWTDVRQYYLNKLNTFEANMESIKKEAEKKEWDKFW